MTLTHSQQSAADTFKVWARINGIKDEPAIVPSDFTPVGGMGPAPLLRYVNDRGFPYFIHIPLMEDFNTEEYELAALLQHFGLPSAIRVGWLKFNGLEPPPPRGMYQIVDPPVPASSVGPPIEGIPGAFRIMHGDPQEGAILEEGGKRYVCRAPNMFFRYWQLIS